ncbi:conserved protein of unknown function [Petrocella atlantisensis]|uniref:Schlafen group 3-like DNA/RNA helicase domain-containing protein n=1 Tax=Petrocella atlantisensis TaxID=2173034 RepID=A0A3P7P128_9FIRM|nr:DNA/RNA helicase domain-containing protein [Petrocella atlantisensis]VDN47170.1 conserved protein of unknown function [Petrocella atlantisensis]
MIIYKSTAYEFDLDVRYNKISDKLESEFKRVLGRDVSDSERRSFSNSLSKMNEVLINEDLVKKDCGVLIEYQLPSSSMRLDFMITGKDKFMNKNAVIVELKQWEKVEECNTSRQVYTYTGGRMREVNHPAVQVGTYKTYLEDYHSAFHKGMEETIKLFACSYLHNYKPIVGDKLLDMKFKSYLEEYPIFTADKTNQIGQFIKNNVEKGDGIELINIIEKSISKPSKKLIEHVNNIIDSKSEFILVDEQLVVFDRVMQLVRDNALIGTDERFVVIVKGGPGTGKSVVGLNLLSKILEAGKECVYLAANAAFKNGMMNKIDKDRAKVLFKHPYFYNKELTISDTTFQSVIVDEAHRLSTTPPPMQKSLDHTLVEEIISKTALSVFFTDDNQMIRPKDIGSYSHVKEVAETMGCEIYEYELDAQFRCAGSEGYLNWLDDVLGIKDTANASGWENLDNLEFYIVDNPNDLKMKMQMYQSIGLTSRVVAGYAWPWSKELTVGGKLINDVNIYEGSDLIFEMPWNPQDSYKGKRAKGIPKNTVEWAIDPIGVNQVGCIHTCQGLEFDYVGVIIGEEFKYNISTSSWEADVNKCFDTKIGKNSQKEFLRLAKNTYKTLLTRGIKGVYVYAVDKGTQDYLKSRLNIVKEIDDSRFYHTKKISLDEIFTKIGSTRMVAEDGGIFIEPESIKISKYNITPLNDIYMYCDIVEEHFLYDSLKLYAKRTVNDIDLDLKTVLESMPQVRNYSEVYQDLMADVGFMKFQILAIVKRVLKDENIISVVFVK